MGTGSKIIPICVTSFIDDPKKVVCWTISFREASVKKPCYWSKSPSPSYHGSAWARGGVGGGGGHVDGGLPAAQQCGESERWLFNPSSSSFTSSPLPIEFSLSHSRTFKRWRTSKITKQKNVSHHHPRYNFLPFGQFHVMVSWTFKTFNILEDDSLFTCFDQFALP